jgi:hypothetical protein
MIIREMGGLVGDALACWVRIRNCNKAVFRMICYSVGMFRINREKFTFCVKKSLEHLKNLKADRVPYFGLELTFHIIKFKIHLVRQTVPLNKQKDYLK